MKMITLLILSFVVVAGLSGCVFVTKKQLEGKLPQIDAELVEVEASTIYGVSGTLVETDVKWVDGKKTVAESSLRVTSPVGSYKRRIKGVVVSPKPETKSRETE